MLSQCWVGTGGAGTVAAIAAVVVAAAVAASAAAAVAVATAAVAAAAATAATIIDSVVLQGSGDSIFKFSPLNEQCLFYYQRRLFCFFW